MILGEHSVQGLFGFVLWASESASTRDPTPTPSSHLQAAFPPTGPSGHAHGHLSRGHGAASHRPVCAWGPQRPAGDRRGCPTPSVHPPPRARTFHVCPHHGRKGRGEGKMSQATWSDEGNRRVGLLSHDGGWSRALTLEGAPEACGEPPARPPDRADSALSLTARDVVDHGSVCFSDVSCSFFFFFCQEHINTWSCFHI